MRFLRVSFRNPALRPWLGAVLLLAMVAWGAQAPVRLRHVAQAADWPAGVVICGLDVADTSDGQAGHDGCCPGCFCCHLVAHWALPASAGLPGFALPPLRVAAPPVQAVPGTAVAWLPQATGPPSI